MMKLRPYKPCDAYEITKWFTCKVDEPTIKSYIKEQESEMRIV